MLVFTILFVGFSISVAFSPIYEVFVVTRALAGAWCLGAFLAAFTYGKSQGCTHRRT